MKYREVEKALLTSQQRQRDDLKALRCERCSGTGQVDDSDIGDISFNVFPCKPCNGSGWKRGKSVSRNLQSRMSKAERD